MIATMQKVQIGVPATLTQALLTWLQDQEIVHVVPLEVNQEGEASTTQQDLAELQFALEFLDRVRGELNIQRKRSFKNMFASKPMADLAELEAALNKANLSVTLERIQRASADLARLTSERQVLQERSEVLSPWEPLQLRGGQNAAHPQIRHMLLTVSLAEEGRLQERLNNIPTVAWQEVYRVVEKKQGTLHWEVIVHSDDQAALEQALVDTTANEVDLELEGGLTVAESMAAVKKRLEELEVEYKNELEAVRIVLKKENTLKMAYDALLHRLERERIVQDGQQSTYTFALSGWVPKKQISRFTGELEREFAAAALVEVEAEEDEVPPVMFENPKPMQAFEAVTDVYGKPKYSELDPSPLLAVFFLVSFGLALTDAGYGIVMMIVMGAAERFFHLKRGIRKMIRLLFYAGATTTVTGAMTGGWFGITLENLPAGAVRDVLLSMKLIDPVSNPIGLLMVAFLIGIVQLLFAYGVKAYDLYRGGKKVAAVYDGVLWITMVVSILAWAATRQGLLDASLSSMLGWLTIANAGALVLTQGRENKNVFVRFGSGVLSLYGLVNFLSDVLSYSRLLALGLATGIIGLVVNLIAGMAVEMIPVVGIVVAVLVLLGGHLFNLGINALGAFIHSGRLQFVEFFPKFMEGGGVAFKPLGRVSKYVDNPHEFVN